jgi:hypothetical protein
MPYHGEVYYCGEYLGIHSVKMLKHHEELNLCLSRRSLVADGFSAQASFIRNVRIGVLSEYKKHLERERDLVNEVKRLVAVDGRSLSNIVEEYFKSLVFERWAELLGEEMDLGA